MTRNPAWLAASLLLLVVLACSFGKKSTTERGSRNSNESSSEPEVASGVSIAEAHMAKDDNGAPGEEVDSFSTTDHTFHCVVQLNQSKSGTKMRFSWWLVDADGTQNEKIRDIDYTTKALENIVHGHLTRPQDWPKGKYKVEVYVNDSLDKTIPFDVD